MLQRRQPFQDFLKSVPLVNAHHKPVTWNINRLEELPFLLHCVEFNAVFVVEAVVVVPVSYTHLDVYKRQVYSRTPHGCGDDLFRYGGQPPIASPAPGFH